MFCTPVVRIIALMVVVAGFFSGKVAISADDVREVISFQIENISNSWGSISPDITTLVTSLRVNSTKIPEDSLSIFCNIKLNDINIFGGEVDDFILEKESNFSLIYFPTRINNNSESITNWWISHIKNNETTEVTIQGELRINYIGNTLVKPFLWRNEFKTDILEDVNIENIRTLEFGLYTLEVKSLQSAWGQITSDRTEIKHTLAIYNSSIIPGAPIVNRVEYELSLNGIEMTKKGVDLPFLIWPGQTKYINFTTELDSEKMKEWWVSHVQSNEKSIYDLKYTLCVEFFGAKIARWPEEIESSFATDFLGKREINDL